MRTAYNTMVGSIFLCAALIAASCGGDDSTGGPTSAGAAGSTSAGAGGSGAGGSGAGGSGTSTTTGTGTTTGSGGSRSEAGACPASQPGAGSACSSDMPCTYGQTTCDCVASMWTCTGGGGDGGSADCPMEAPGPGDSCTKEGLTCTYDGGHTMCTCSVADGWGCVASAGR